ncbi:MAG: hypothetical protein AAF602_33680 [Myxococcota bacterium]
MSTIVVTDTQAFRKAIPAAEAGMNVGLLLRGVRREDVERGQIVATPGSVKPHQRAVAEFYVLTAEEGGRRKPFTSGYSPHFHFGATSVTGTIDVGEALVQPGDRATVRFDLVRAVGMEPGVRFAVREGGRTIGAGVVTEVS